MHTKNIYSLCTHFHPGVLSLKENRLIFETPQAGEREREAGVEGQAGGNPVENIRRQQGDAVRNAVPQAAEGPGVRDAVQNRNNRRRRTPEGQPENNQPEAAGQPAEHPNPPAPAEPAAQAATQPGRIKRFASYLSNPFSDSTETTLVKSGITGGALSGSFLAGLAPEKAAAIAPALGKFGVAVKGMLDTASATVSHAVTGVGVPELSFLANPWVIGTLAPVLGLGMLGKTWIWGRKYFYEMLGDKNYPTLQKWKKAFEERSKTYFDEKTGFLRRQLISVYEGSNALGGLITKPLSFPFRALGWAGGKLGNIGLNLGEYMGKVGGLLKSPIKNAKHLGLGALGGVGGGLLAGAAGATLLGTFAPWAVIGGIPAAIWAYNKSKNGTGSSGGSTPSAA
ncbi:hypothetical protein COU76_00360 [Candidatus Peregrinibacteria bacterium CG10_big_fil_rev_8_21_14_0_10_49_10]|nr:MAG: hypothetical protein COU76_00360 [Candidatus Peregrinibacteria bacterium CG10_big_fil_rev_8_21_14_0_10_49_10]